MIWLTWRQCRVQVASAAGAVAVFAAILAVTGVPLASLFTSSRIGSCHGGSGECGAFADAFLQQLYDGTGITSWTVTHLGGYWPLYLFGIVVILAAPALIGMFWGAPLIAGELEAGTHHLVWTQSITRTRWLAIKLTLTGLAALAVTEALSQVQAWWATPISLTVARGACCNPMAMNQFSPLVFATQGIAPLGYAAFAFVLGVTVGLLVRRAVLAMALTLAIFALLQVAMPLWVRPNLFTPDHTLTTLSSWGSVDVLVSSNGPGQSGTFTVTPVGFSEPEAWILSTSGAVNAVGQPVSIFPAACLPSGSGKADNSALLDCLDSHGIRIAVTYQPASRYLTFQWTETAIYAALALVLAGFCFWRLERRLT